MKNTFLGTMLVLCVAGIALAHAASTTPTTTATSATSATTNATTNASAPPRAASSPPPEAARGGQGFETTVVKPSRVEGDFYEYLYELSYRLSDAYADRLETVDAKAFRIGEFTRGVMNAVVASDLSSDDKWRYAVTMIYVAHRETRIARRPSQLGDQDQGRAHGPWQVWSWHGADPFAPSTALTMMIEAPESSWSLPKGAPWMGYPPADRYIREHPFQGKL